MSGIDNTVLPSYAFYYYWSLTEVILPIDLKKISNNAFEGCRILTEVNLSNVTSLGEDAFYGCRSLSGVDLSNVTLLGRWAFDGCWNLTLADGTNLSANLKEIPYCAFYGCVSLTGVDLSNVTSLDVGAFYGCENLTLADGTNLSANLKEIPYCAFYRCRNLTGVDLSNVTFLGAWAFSYCENLKSIALPEVEPFIDEGAFNNVSSLLLLVEGGGVYDNLDEFPEGSAYPSISGAMAVSAGNTLSLAISPEGGNGISCQWYFNQSVLPGETRETLAISNAKASNSGMYECEISLGTVSQRISKTVSVSSVGLSRSGGSSSSSAKTGTWMKDAVGWWYHMETVLIPGRNGSRSMANGTILRHQVI